MDAAFSTLLKFSPNHHNPGTVNNRTRNNRPSMQQQRPNHAQDKSRPYVYAPVAAAAAALAPASTQNSREDIFEQSKEELKRDLPNAYTVDEILTYMQGFNIDEKKIPTLEYTKTADDEALEHNIHIVFNEDSLWKKSELSEALMDIVKMEDPLMHPSEKKKLYGKKDRQISKEKKTLFKLFYPQLIGLMFAIYCHTKRYSKAMIVKSDTNTVISHEIIKMWEHVFSQLSLICNIIIYANEKEKDGDNEQAGDGFLVGLPQSWNIYIIQQRKRQNEKNEQKIQLERAMNIVQQEIINMEAEINAIKRKYEEKDAKFRQMSTEYENITQQIYGFVNVIRVTKANERLLDKYRELNAA